MSLLTATTRVTVFVSAFIAVFIGAMVAGWLSLLGLASMPTAALMVVLLAVVAVPILSTRLPLAVCCFLTWLVVEDLVRKQAGNDIRVYFVKDVLFATVIVALILEARRRGAWKEATGRARFFLYVMVSWALIMSVPSGLDDWRLPVIGLRLDFMYFPLTAVGFLLMKEARDLPKWLGGLTVLTGAASAIGIAQVIIGPNFLSPGVSTPGLIHLVLVRGIGANSVYRPTGTFVDPSRFAGMALIGVALGLAALSVKSGKFRPWVLAGSVTSAAAVWISGGRSPFIGVLLLLLLALIAPSIAERRVSVSRAVGSGGSLILAVTVVGVFQPTLFTTRADWYRATLDPASQDNEWEYRFVGYGRNTLRGIALGGLLGEGTGKESLGKQYIYGGRQQSPFGLYQIEGGYAAVAVEWGIVGLVLWILWTSAWSRRLWKCITKVRGSPLATPGILLFAWIIFFLFIGFVAGMQGYQNYVGNAYFWLLSGMVFALPRVLALDDLNQPSEPRESLAFVAH